MATTRAASPTAATVLANAIEDRVAELKMVDRTNPLRGEVLLREIFELGRWLQRTMGENP